MVILTITLVQVLCVSSIAKTLYWNMAWEAIFATPGKVEDAVPASVADRAASLWRSARMVSTRRTRRDGAKTWSGRPSGWAWRGLPTGIASQVEGRREGRERCQRGLTDFFSRFSIETRKSLNTKVVHNSKFYNFHFRYFLVWSFVWKLKFETRVCLKLSYTLRISKFSSIFVWQLEKRWTWKLFII